MNRIFVFFLAGFVAHPVSAARPPPHQITLPPETVFLQPSALPGYTYAVATCAICHSADYIQAQPPAANWEVEVQKMKKLYGAPVIDAQVGALADYLTKTYGAGSAARQQPPAVSHP